MMEPIPHQAPFEWFKAMDQFNAQEFWECHETLEPLWLPAGEPLKTFLQGVIQAAAGFHHISRGNAKGALSLLSQSLEKVHRVSGVAVLHQWLDFTVFIEETESAQAEVQRLGAERLHLFCPGKFPVMLPLPVA